MRWGELQKNHFQPSNSFFFSDLDSAPNLHPYTRTRIKFALGGAGLSTLGRAGLRHVILSRGPPAWAAQTPSGKPRASVAVVGCGETKQLQRLPPALPPRSFSPSTRFEHTLQTPAFFPSPKSQGGKRTPKAEDRRPSLKTPRASSLPVLFPPFSSAYLAQEVDIVEGGQKCGRHVSGSCNGRSCRLGGPEEPSGRRGRA